MSRPPTPITGRCLCGAATYVADADPVVQAVCRATGCQRQTGGPFSALVGVPRAAFRCEGSTLASSSTVGEDHGAPEVEAWTSSAQPWSPRFAGTEPLARGPR